MSSDVDWHTSERTGKFSASHFRYHASLSLMNSPQNIHTNSYHRAAHSPCFVIMRCCGRRKNLSHAIALSCRYLCFPLVCCCMMMMSNENGNYWKQHQKPEINGIKFFQLMLFLTMRRVEMPMKIQWMKSGGIFELFMIFFMMKKWANILASLWKSQRDYWLIPDVEKCYFHFGK